ncbi:MAG: zinc-ribbon domain-containing protein [Gammaproteobacteria bacterium]|nr:zinc-ribbon domain-containing protein [Gammaproteobacteria bacterium]
MYTQCPDCSTAFRVTAEVLKQAAGKVRCGGCGIAFNALEYLSEQMPEQPATKEVEAPLPELTPEPRQPEEQAPMAISAEQSAALLKTLDELAGDDIRIEDTGVEWRVLDEDDGAVDEANDAVDVDEFLDESPTPVDQFLTKTPNTIDAGEIFEESANAPGQTEVDELRFDDNTPLPDDFDIDDESSYVAQKPNTDAHTGESLQSEHPRDRDETPIDIALGEPEEWADILGEFSEPHKPYVPPLDAELAALEEAEKSTESPVEQDRPLDVDTQFALQAEAMGIDLSGMHPAPAGERGEQEDSAEGREVAGAAAAEQEDDEAATFANEDVSSGLELADESGAQPEIPELDETEETGEVSALELGDDTGEALQLEGDLEDQPESSIELQAEADTQQEPGPESGADDDEDAPLEFGAVEDAMAELEEQSDVFDKDFFDGDADDKADDEDVANDDEPELDEIVIEDEPHDDDKSTADALDEEALALDDGSRGNAPDGDGEDIEAVSEDDELALNEESQDDEPDDEDKAVEDALDEDELALDDESRHDGPDDEDEAIEDALDEDELALDDAPHDDEPDVAAAAQTEHEVPPQTEEEQTLNLLIDQELLSMAVEDKDGFASTIVFADKGAEESSAEASEIAETEDAEAGFESIIMEGEFVRTALEQEKRKANIAEAAELAEKARLAREAEAEKARSGSRRGMAAAAVLLLLVLVVQVMHQSREALATIPAFNDTVGPLYRAIGMPLSPAWDVTGWRFEARRDILDEEANTLTVISRIGNTSEKPLPYPLVNISLTDRFEETVGTKTLDPADYLTDDLDPSKMVRPGNNFTAVMTIESPSVNATGYKLQACYRQPDAQLRCHIPTFK